MKNLLRKGLDAYEDGRERRDEEFAELVGRHVDAMSHRPTLKVYAITLGVVNLLFWASVLIRPFDVLAAFRKVGNVDERLVAFTIVCVFGIGLWLTYSLFRIWFPELENVDKTAGLMSAFAVQENSTRKVRIWVMSVAGGVINLLALAIVEGLLVSN